MSRAVRFGQQVIEPGERRDVELPVARLPTGTWMSLPVAVINGSEPGPALWLDATLHGDEVNGIEIIRRVLAKIDPEELSGQVFAVPVVNVFGFIQQTRYLPDRRDLNRSFPGSPRGSLAGRLAHLFVTEIVARCQYGIDLHTGSLHRTNLPQIRADLKHPETRRLADAFGPPLLFHAKRRSGSLRGAAGRLGVPVLVYEGGEPLRFDRWAIRAGVAGVQRVLLELGMCDLQPPPIAEPPFESSDTRWIRATRSGIFYLDVELGQHVYRGTALGHISEPLSPRERLIKAPGESLVIGHTNNPLVHQGEALVHLARREGADPPTRPDGARRSPKS